MQEVRAFTVPHGLAALTAALCSSMFRGMVECATGEDFSLPERTVILTIMLQLRTSGTFDGSFNCGDIGNVLGALNKYDLDNLIPCFITAAKGLIRVNGGPELNPHLTNTELAETAGTLQDDALFTWAVEHFQEGEGSDGTPRHIDPYNITPRHAERLGMRYYRALAGAVRVVEGAKIDIDHPLYWRFVAGCLSTTETS